MNDLIEETYFEQHHFTSFEVFSSVLVGYNMSLKQIDCGRFSAILQHIQSGPVTINRFTTTRRMEAIGNPPPGTRTFGIPAEKCQPFVWRNKKSAADTIQIYKPSTELDINTQPMFEATDVSITENDFNTLNHQWGYPELDKIIGCKEMVICDPDKMHVLRETLHYICEAKIHKSNSRMQIIGLKNLIEYEVPKLLAQALMTSEAGAVKATPAKRNHALKTAIEYIRSTSNEVITLNALCRDTGINERTLQRAFQDKYDVTPKHYILMHRLNNAYKSLLRSDYDSNKVTDIAINQGFSHMGQFSKDYRRQFGELPSETLKQSIST